MFLQFRIISEDSRRLPKISEGYRRGTKIVEDVRRTLRKLSPETQTLNPIQTRRASRMMAGLLFYNLSLNLLMLNDHISLEMIRN